MGRRGRRGWCYRRCSSCYRPFPPQKEPIPEIHLCLLEPDVDLVGVGALVPGAASGGIPVVHVTAATMMVPRQLPVHLSLPPPQLALRTPLLHAEDLLVHAARAALLFVASLAVPRRAWNHGGCGSGLFHCRSVLGGLKSNWGIVVLIVVVLAIALCEKPLIVCDRGPLDASSGGNCGGGSCSCRGRGQGVGPRPGRAWNQGRIG